MWKFLIKLQTVLKVECMDIRLRERDAIILPIRDSSEFSFEMFVSGIRLRSS